MIRMVVDVICYKTPSPIDRIRQVGNHLPNGSDIVGPGWKQKVCFGMQPLVDANEKKATAILGDAKTYSVDLTLSHAKPCLLKSGDNLSKPLAVFRRAKPENILKNEELNVEFTLECFKDVAVTER